MRGELSFQEAGDPSRPHPSHDRPIGGQLVGVGGGGEPGVESKGESGIKIQASQNNALILHNILILIHKGVITFVKKSAFMQ